MNMKEFLSSTSQIKNMLTRVIGMNEKVDVYIDRMREKRVHTPCHAAGCSTPLPSPLWPERQAGISLTSLFLFTASTCGRPMIRNTRYFFFFGQYIKNQFLNRSYVKSL